MDINCAKALRFTWEGAQPRIMLPPYSKSSSSAYIIHSYNWTKIFQKSFSAMHVCRWGGSTTRLGGRELTLLSYGFNQYTLLQNRDNSGLLGTPLYCTLKLRGRYPPMLKLGGGGAATPLPPPVEHPLVC